MSEKNEKEEYANTNFEVLFSSENGEGRKLFNELIELPQSSTSIIDLKTYFRIVSSAEQLANKYFLLVFENKLQIVQNVKFEASELQIVYSNQKSKPLNLEIDFSSREYSREVLSVKKELMAKAFGHQAGNKTVLDLTAGMGLDSVFATKLGFQVTAIERHPALYFLLRQALIRHPIEGLSFYLGESTYILNRTDLFTDVIYYDPMYPSKKNKTALPNKNMQIFRELLGTDQDDISLLQRALLRCKNRLVIKRPLEAPPIDIAIFDSLKANTGSVSYVGYEGKLVRFDAFIKTRQ